MNEIKVYEPKIELCKICNERQSLLLPLCEIDGELKTYPVCVECKDKIPYRTIPVKTTLSQGYCCLKTSPKLI